MRNRRAVLAALAWVWGAAGGCVPQPLDIQPAELPAGVQGRAYSEVLGVDVDAEVRWEVASGSLPAGLSLTSDGAIAGTPADAGTFGFTIGARADTAPLPREGTRGYSIRIIPRLALSVTLPVARRDVPYAATPSISGGQEPYQVSVTGLPAGMSFDASSGAIGGTPINTSDGVTLLFRVFDAGQPPLQQTIESFATLIIKPPPVAIATGELPGGAVGAAYEATLTVTEGTGDPPFTWSVFSGVLPDGLRLDLGTGVISGTPTVAGTFTFTIRVRDDDRPATDAQREFLITVAES